MCRLALILLVAPLALTYGAIEKVLKHPLSDMPPSGQISTGYFFPDHPTKQFPAGEEVKIVVGIHNDSPEPYNISSILGSVNSPADFKTYIHNLTHQSYMMVVPPSAELSVEYKFVPHPMLPPSSYVVALTLFYEGSQGFHSTTFFNQTVEVVEVKKVVDWELLSLMGLLILIFLAGGYFLAQYLAPLGLFKPFSRKAKRVETTQRGDTDDEWVKGTPYDLHRKRQQAASNKAAAKKSS